MNEEWKPIPGYEGHFEVSNMGRVKALARKCNLNYRGRLKTTRVRKERIMAFNPLKSGYPLVHLNLDGKRKAELVHRLVLTAWVRPPLKGETGNHKNFIKSDNRLENLEWVSQAENNHHKLINGKSRNVKLTADDVRLIRYWAVPVPRGCNKGLGKILGKIFGVGNGSINNVVSRATFPHVL